MESGKVLLGALAGFAAGAVIGILFAPDKGSNTRKSISSKSDDYADMLKEKFDEMLDKLGKKYENTKDDAEDLVAKGKSKYNEVKNDLRDNAEDLAAKGKAKYNEVKDDVKTATSSAYNGK